jgi:hypothetical protein
VYVRFEGEVVGREEVEEEEEGVKEREGEGVEEG